MIYVCIQQNLLQKEVVVVVASTAFSQETKSSTILNLKKVGSNVVNTMVNIIHTVNRLNRAKIPSVAVVCFRSVGCLVLWLIVVRFDWPRHS